MIFGEFLLRRLIPVLEVTDITVTTGRGRIAERATTDQDDRNGHLGFGHGIEPYKVYDQGSQGAAVRKNGEFMEKVPVGGKREYLTGNWRGDIITVQPRGKRR